MQLSESYWEEQFWVGSNAGRLLSDDEKKKTSRLLTAISEKKKQNVFTKSSSSKRKLLFEDEIMAILGAQNLLHLDCSKKARPFPKLICFFFSAPLHYSSFLFQRLRNFCVSMRGCVFVFFFGD